MGAVYDKLSITERRKIERWRHAKVHDIPRAKAQPFLGRKHARMRWLLRCRGPYDASGSSCPGALADETP